MIKEKSPQGFYRGERHGPLLERYSRRRQGCSRCCLNGIKHNICYCSYIVYMRREEQFVCYLLICPECKNADKNLSKTGSKTAWTAGRTLSSDFQFRCRNKCSVTPHIILPLAVFSYGCAVQLLCCPVGQGLILACFLLEPGPLAVHVRLRRRTQAFCGHKVRENPSSLRQ